MYVRDTNQPFLESLYHGLWLFLVITKKHYRNTIVGSPLDERIFIYFWKNKVRLSKIEFLNFCFLAKKINKNDLK